MAPPRRCDPDKVIALNAEGLSQREIARHFGVNQCSISELLKRHGVKSFREPGSPRRYKLDEECFATIDTPEKAYWLGFLAADGFIVIHKGDPRGLGVRLVASDIGHLQLLAGALGSEAKPKIGNDGAARVIFNSRRLAADLIAHGITPRKSWTCSPWDAPEELAPHYWRGLIDGDGHIGVGTKPKEKQVVFVGTQAMAEGFRSFAAEVCGTGAVPHQRPGCWTMQIQGRRQVHALLSVLYAEDWVALARKKKVALAITAEPYTPLRFRRPCRMKKCPNLAIAHLLCKKHYQRWKAHGDPLVTKIDRGDPDAIVVRALALPMAEMIVRDRQAGKTTDLIRLAAENFAYIVCPNQRQATQIARQAKGMGLDIPFPLTADEFVRGEFYGRGIRGFLFDNLDQIMQQMAHGVPVIAASWTAEGTS